MAPADFALDGVAVSQRGGKAKNFYALADLARLKKWAPMRAIDEVPALFTPQLDHPLATLSRGGGRTAVR